MAAEQLSFSSLLEGFKPVIKTWVAEAIHEASLKVTQSTKESDIWFDLDGFCEYHPDKPKKPTVYGWVHSRSVPCHRGQKKLRFLKSEIDLWLKQDRKKTYAETALEADKYLANKGRRCAK
ncbi:MAG TPA: helix-turn-helix domain-containing protein [Prolixibacteraceae bacterium]|jgi:hypothetical protein